MNDMNDMINPDECDSYTVVVVDDITGRVTQTSEWECDTTVCPLIQHAANALARLVAAGGTGAVTCAIHYHSAWV